MTTKNNSTVMRTLKQFGLGALVGGLIGFFVAYWFDKLHTSSLNRFIISDYLAVVTLVIGAVLTAVSFYQLHRVKKNYEHYQLSDADDDETETIYRQLEKSHSYVMIYTGLSLVALIAHLLFSYRFIVRPSSAHLEISLLGILLVIVVGLLQMWAIKWYNKIRQIKVPLVPTLKELKNNVMQMDEAELEANYKISFEIVMNLSGVVLPVIYGLVLLEGALLQTVNITAILATAGIHLYIILMQFKMVKHFYK